MRKLSKVIVETGAENIDDSNWVRKTARGIFVDGDKVLMLYSHSYDDYTFPGGGVKRGETYQRTLYRELSEEVGAYGIKIVKAFGQTLEIRRSVRFKDQTYRQISKYFFVTALGFGSQRLESREEAHGIKPVWIKPADALAHNQRVIYNEMHQKIGAKTTILRDNAVLTELIKEGLK